MEFVYLDILLGPKTTGFLLINLRMLSISHSSLSGGGVGGLATLDGIGGGGFLADISNFLFVDPHCWLTGFFFNFLADGLVMILGGF